MAPVAAAMQLCFSSPANAATRHGGFESRRDQNLTVDPADNSAITARNVSLGLSIVPESNPELAKVIDATGGGADNSLIAARDITVDGAGNAYVAGVGTDNAFEIAPPDADGDGVPDIEKVCRNTPVGLPVDCEDRPLRGHQPRRPRRTRRRMTHNPPIIHGIIPKPPRPHSEMPQLGGGQASPMPSPSVSA